MELGTITLLVSCPFAKILLFLQLRFSSPPPPHFYIVKRKIAKIHKESEKK